MKLPDVVDNEYTYTLILTFPSKEIQNKYQEEQAHQVFIKESSHLWNKVKVYDSVEISNFLQKFIETIKVYELLVMK